MAKRKVHRPEFDEVASLAWREHARYILRHVGCDFSEDASLEQMRYAADSLRGTKYNTAALMVLAALGDSELGVPFRPYEYFRDR